MTVDVNKDDKNKQEPSDEMESNNFEKYDDVVKEKGNVTLTEPINEPKPKVYRNCVTGKTYGTVEVNNNYLKLNNNTILIKFIHQHKRD